MCTFVDRKLGQLIFYEKSILPQQAKEIILIFSRHLTANKFGF